MAEANCGLQLDTTSGEGSLGAVEREGEATGRERVTRRGMANLSCSC
jgi:hypothetical protein